MYTPIDSGKGSQEQGDVPGDEEPVACHMARADEEASTSSAVGDCEASEAEGEGIPLIQIRTYGDRVKDGETGPLSPDQLQCRICLDSGGEDLISPCRCRGTQKFVHRECLDNWRATKEGFAFANCTECRSAFYLRANLPPDRWWLRLKFQLLVLRDHAAIFIIVQLVVGLLGLVVYTFYGEDLRDMFGYERHPLGFYALVGHVQDPYSVHCPRGGDEMALTPNLVLLCLAVTVALLIGLLYGFFIAIICGQNISNRHHHILAKQELTKEYVVENFNEDEEPPELDSGHIKELKMLGLL